MTRNKGTKIQQNNFNKNLNKIQIEFRQDTSLYPHKMLSLGDLQGPIWKLAKETLYMFTLTTCVVTEVHQNYSVCFLQMLNSYSLCFPLNTWSQETGKLNISLSKILMLQ